MSVPTGQLVAWSYATNFFFDPGRFPGDVTGSATATCGGLTVGTGVLGSLGADYYWTGFTLPTLPQGAVIQDMKAVAVADNPGTVPSAIFGPYHWGAPSPPYSSLLIVGTSMGNNPNNIGGQTLAQQQFQAHAGASVPGTYNAFVGFDFLGIAIIYSVPDRRPISTWVNIGNTRPNQ